MGSAILFNAARMQDIEDGTITSGLVDVNGDLILTRHDETEINAGHVRGEDGVDGDDGRSAYQVWLDAGNTGTEEDFLEAIKGVDGETGLPAGAIMAWTISTIPDNWLECNGQAISRETYTDLFSILGTQYGSGDGSTTFNLPDYRGLTLVGLSADVEFDTLGKNGGEKTHVLTIDEMPSHTHIQNSHSHAQNVTALSGGSALRNDYDSDSNGGTYPQGVNTGATTATNQNTGGGLSHNNLQPYSVVKYIIKASGGLGTVSNTVETLLTGRVADVEDSVAAINLWTGANRPAFKAVGVGTQARSGSESFVKVPLTSEYMDRKDNYDASNSRFTAPVTGLYQFSFGLCIIASASGPEARLYKNGTDSGMGNLAIGYAGAYQTFGATVEMWLNSGDYVELFAQNNNNTSFTFDLTRCSFSGHYIG